MTRSSPRDFLRSHLLACGLLVCAAAIVAAAGGDWLLGVAVLLAVPALDRAALASVTPWRREDLEIAVAMDAENSRSAATVGGVVVLRARLSNRGSHPARGLLRPVAPSDLEPIAPATIRFDLPPERTVRAEFRFRTRRVGTAVSPGVLLERPSPLRFFRRMLLLVRRAEVSVLPAYGQSDHPVVSRFLRPGLDVGDRSRSRAVKGAGTEFSEIREYRIPDSFRRVDWKATARRSRLMIREYEEPRELTLRVFLDGSRDLTEGEESGAAFARAANLVAKLAYVAAVQSMGMTLTVYDRAVVLDRRLSLHGLGLQRLLVDLVAIPRMALLRSAREATSSQDLVDLGERRFAATIARWRGEGPEEDLESFLARYREGRTTDAATYLADLHADALGRLENRCETCGRIVFADENGCRFCRTGGDAGGMPPRAASLAAALSGALRRSRGREVWVVISSLRGGEACDVVARLLGLAAAGHRAVHTALPASRPLSKTYATAPRSMGACPTLADTLADTESLYSSASLGEFKREVLAAGVAVHSLSSGPELEEIVAKLLLAEVLA